MKCLGLTLSAVLAGAAFAMPAGAADEALKKALDDYGSAAGKIAASVPFCGGPEKELAYFIAQVKQLAEKAGAGPLEWAAIAIAMQKSSAAAEIENHHCTEDGGRSLATDLLEKQKALQAALN